MAEFVDVIKEFNRMHEYELNEGSCRVCGVSSYKNGKGINCDYFIKKYPQESEKIIMDWAKEHPIVTNKDKFREVFGEDMSESLGSCPFANSLKCRNEFSCVGCNRYKFWEQEYKEPSLLCDEN